MEPTDTPSNVSEHLSSQFSLWGLLVFVGITACIGAGIRAGSPALLLVFFAIALSGIGAFGYIAFQLLGAVVDQSSVRFKSLGKLIGNAILGTTFVYAIFSLGWMICHSFTVRAEQDIDYRYIRFHEALLTNNYREAYDIMSPKYRSANSLTAFQQVCHKWDATWLSPGRSIRFEGKKAYLYPRSTEGWFELWSGYEFHLEKVDGAWYLTGETNFYLD